MSLAFLVRRLENVDDLTETPRHELRRALRQLDDAFAVEPDPAAPYIELMRQPVIAAMTPTKAYAQLHVSLNDSADALDALAGLRPTLQFPHLRSAIEAGTMLRYLTEDPAKLYDAYLLVLDGDWRKQRDTAERPFSKAYQVRTGEEPPTRYWTHSAQLTYWRRNDTDTRVASELEKTWGKLSAYSHGSFVVTEWGEEEGWGIVQMDVDLGVSIWALAELVTVCARQIMTAKGLSASS